MRVSLKIEVSGARNSVYTKLAGLDPEEEQTKQAEIKEKFKPLLSWLKIQVQDIVRDGSY